VILHSKTEDGVIGLKVRRGESVKPILFYVIGALIMLGISALVGMMYWYYALMFLVAYIVYGILAIIDDRRAHRLAVPTDANAISPHTE
jgi:Ca2+/Na+ antiporter